MFSKIPVSISYLTGRLNFIEIINHQLFLTVICSDNCPMNLLKLDFNLQRELLHEFGDSVPELQIHLLPPLWLEVHPDKFLWCLKVYYLQYVQHIKPTYNFEEVCASNLTQKVSLTFQIMPSQLALTFYSPARVSPLLSVMTTIL